MNSQKNFGEIFPFPFRDADSSQVELFAQVPFSSERLFKFKIKFLTKIRIRCPCPKEP